MTQKKKILSKILAYIFTYMMLLNSISVQAAEKQAVIPKVDYVTAPVLEYTAGDIVNFDLNAPNYGGRVQYRVVLWDDNKKEARDLWATGDRYYANWMPYGNNNFNLHFRIDEPGSYRITVYVKRAGIPNSNAALKGYNCDSYMESKAFVVKAKAITFDKDGQTYGSNDVNKLEAYMNDISITAKNATFNNARMEGNLTITGDRAVIRNVNIIGKLVVDPGKDGSCTLDNVTAKDIEVLSGGQNSIHIINSSADSMNVNSQSTVRIEVDGDTEIVSTTASGYVIFDRKNGTYGTITITKDEKGETVVEFRGDIKDRVEVETAATIKTGEDSSIANLVINTKNDTDIVKLEGQYDKVDISSKAKLEVAVDTRIENIVANNDAEISLDKTASVTNVDKRGNDVVINQGSDTPIENNNGGSNSGGYVPSIIALRAIDAISGTAKVGTELTAGTLTPSGATAAYQWKICDTVDGAYTNITGATTNKYIPEPDDLGKFIKVSATGTGRYTGTVTSEATGAVGPSSNAGLLSVAAFTDTTPGANSGEDPLNAIAWEVSVPNVKNKLLLSDIIAAENATVKLYDQVSFTTEISELALADTEVGNTVAFIKVTAQDTTTVKYYEVTMHREEPIKVSTITVTGEGNALAVINNKTLQMNAAVAPEDAANKVVIWGVESVSGSATISPSGLLTATGVGKVIVTAKAADGSNVTGTIEITVVPAAPGYTINYIAEKTNEIVPEADEYSFDNGSTWRRGSGTQLELIPGQNVQFRVAASGEIPAGDIQTLVAAARPAEKPSFTYAAGIDDALYGLPASASNLQARISSDNGIFWGLWVDITTDAGGRASLAHAGGDLIQVRFRGIPGTAFGGESTELYSKKAISELGFGDKVVDNSWDWNFKTGDGYTGTGEIKPVTWIVAAKDHYGAGSGVTLLSEKLIGRFVFDNSTDIHENGDTYWRDSTHIRPWLNSSGVYAEEGFYHAFSDEFKAAVLKVSIPNVSQVGSSYVTQDRIFIPSTTELGDSNYTNTYVIGESYSFFKSPTDADTIVTNRIAKLGINNSSYWTRSPDKFWKDIVRCFLADGSQGEGFIEVANRNNGIRPALNLASDVLVSEAPNSSGLYEIYYPQGNQIINVNVNVNNATTVTFNCDVAGAKIKWNGLTVKVGEIDQLTVDGINTITVPVIVSGENNILTVEKTGYTKFIKSDIIWNPVSAISAIIGTPQVGVELTAGSLTPAGATVSYQWMIADMVNGTYANIPGATTNKYTPTAGDTGKFIKVSVTGTGRYSGTVTSAATGAVAAASPISGMAIAGVTAPVFGASPVTMATETSEYTAVVTWSPEDIIFGGNTVYTATITLVPKAGYTLTGITENQFTVAGAASVANAADSGVVAATFPVTIPPPMLNIPENVTLREDGVATWSRVDNVAGYSVELFKDGGHQTSIDVPADTLSANLLTAMRNGGAGLYTVNVNAKGDGKYYADGMKSNLSLFQTVIRPAAVTDRLTWAGDTARWTAVDDAVSYDVQLYKNGAESGPPVNVPAADAASGVNFTSAISAAGPGTYTYTVTAKGDSVLILDAEKSAASNTNTTITGTEITGVTVPQIGAVPATAITQTAEYTGTIIWGPADNPFAVSKVYTATITITPKWGYTLTGVAANQFTVTGAVAVNASNSGVVTAVFPALGETVCGVDAMTANGCYKAGDIIAVAITFSGSVDVTGTPVLHLETGTTDHDAVYFGGSGTSTLIFNYTVQAGDEAADLDYIGIDSLVLSGGTIRNAGTDANAVLTLPAPGTVGSLGASKAIVIDTTAPTAALTYTKDGAACTRAKAGDKVIITATFSEALADTPVVQIAGAGANTVAAAEMTKIDSTHYKYTWTVGAGDGAETFTMLAGKDIVGNVITAAPTSGASTVTVDNTAPTATITTTGNGDGYAEPEETLIITFSEAMTPAVINGSNIETYLVPNISHIEGTMISALWTSDNTVLIITYGIDVLITADCNDSLTPTGFVDIAGNKIVPAEYMIKNTDF